MSATQGGTRGDETAGRAARVTRHRALRLLPLSGAALVGRGAFGAPPTGPRGGTGASSSGALLVANPSRNEWPDRFLRAPADVQEAYRFALANRDVLQYMPCFCGCVGDGHTSNHDCYVKEARPDGSFVLEPMSFG